MSEERRAFYVKSSCWSILTLVLFTVWRRADIAFGLVLYRVSCQCLRLLGLLLWKNKESVSS